MFVTIWIYINFRNLPNYIVVKMISGYLNLFIALFTVFKIFLEHRIIFHLETKRTLIQFERTRSLRDFLTGTVLSMCFRGSCVFCQGFFLAEDSKETTDVFEARTKRTNNFPLNHTRLQFEEKKYIVLCLAENLVQEMHRILSSKLSEASSTSRHIARREQFVGKLPKVKFAIVWSFKHWLATKFQRNKVYS